MNRCRQTEIDSGSNVDLALFSKGDRRMTVENIGAGRKPEAEAPLGLDSVPLFQFGRAPVQSVEQALECWSVLDTKPRIVLERSGRMIACSEIARQIIHANEPIRLERGCIIPADGRYRAQFEGLLRAQAGTVETLLLPCLRDRGHWIVRSTTSDEDHVYISLKQATPNHHARLADIGRAFGLTPCEADVVEGLYNGLSPQDIANEQSISVHTVRAHLRRCYDKMHISCREQLWHRLSAYQL